VLVGSVRHGTGAAKAGLKPATSQVTVEGESWPAGGDVIVKADGQAVPSIERLVDLIATKKPGDNLDLEVVRGTSRIHVNVELGRQP
jgi:S1-C subfamily serine protease